jgi:N-acetylglutamate synthase-like GNAT family acetyltransferase
MDARQFTLRPASQADGQAIRDLVHLGRINPAGLDWRRFIVAEAGPGQVIACGQVKPHRDGSRELASIVVHPAWRGQGAARAVIERLIAEQEGPLYLMCRAQLGAFYARFGFRSLDRDEMPPYFQRISRLAGLIDALGRQGTSLLVMVRDGQA